MEAKSKTKMILKGWHWLMFISALALIVSRDFEDSRTSVRRRPTLQELQAVFSGSVNTNLVSGPIPHFQGTIETAAAPLAAACVSTVSLPPKVKGYVDEVNVLVVMDNGGEIRGIKMIESRETPSYMQRVIDAGFLDSFIGRKAADPAAIEDMDAVTGASVTSQAIRDDVAAAAALAANRLFGLPAPLPAPPSWSKSFMDPRVIAVLLALAAALNARFGRWPRRYRKEAAWVISILFIGVYAMTPYTLVHTFLLLKWNIPGPANALLAVLALFIMVTTLAFGPLWCSYCCPFGALEELLAKLPVKRWKVTPRVMSWSREIRFMVLFAAVVFVFGFDVQAFSGVEPFGYMFGRSADPAAWAFIGVVLFSAVFVRRFWCRFFCPTGACLVMLSSHRKLLKSVERGLDDSAIDRADPEDGRDAAEKNIERQNTRGAQDGK